MSRGFVALLCLVSVCLGDGLTFYVDGQKGSDSNNGTVVSAPFLTLQKATQAVKNIMYGHNIPSSILVLLRGGTYSFTSTLYMDASNSGSSSCMITYASYPGETALLSGGTQIPVSSFERASHPDLSAAGIVQVDLKKLGITDYGAIEPSPNNNWLGYCQSTKLGEFFFNGEPMLIARYPNLFPNGTWQWMNINATVHDKNDVFVYGDKRTDRWASTPNVWMHGYWAVDWADNYVKIASIDTSAHTITVDSSTPILYGLNALARYYALNILSELDAPGEYFVDTSAGVLYFMPPATLTGSDVAWFSGGGIIMQLANTHHVTLRDLTFGYARTGGITVLGNAYNINLINNTIINIGGHGVVYAAANSSLMGNTLHGQGCSGFQSANAGDEKTLQRGNLTVSYNTIHDYARMTRSYNPGLGWGGVGNYYGHNTIYNAPHVAVLGGGNDCLFEYLEIHHVVYECDDAGAFYTGNTWYHRGNVIRFSDFHDIVLHENPQLGTIHIQAVYFDDQESGWTVYNNTFENMERGVFIGGGRDMLIYNNHFNNVTWGVYQDNRGMGWQQNTCKPGGSLEQGLESMNYKNPPWSVHYPYLVNIMNDHPCVPVNDTVRDNTYCNGRMNNIQPDQIASWFDTYTNNVQKCP